MLDPSPRLPHVIGVSFLKSPAFIVIASQLLFSISDYLGARAMKAQGFTLANFFSWWFLSYTVIRQIAVIGQLYVYATGGLGRTVALFGAGSIIIGNLIAVLLLQEILKPHEYIGISVAILAFLVLAFWPEAARA